MAVISRHRAEEFYLIQLAPGGISHKSQKHSAADRIVHDVQAGVAVDDNLIRPHADHPGHQFLRLGNTVGHTVVSCVGAVLRLHGGLRIQSVQKSHGQIKLLGGRFSSGHIQLQIPALIFLIFLHQIFLFRRQFLSRHVKIRLHVTSSLCFPYCTLRFPLWDISCPSPLHSSFSSGHPSASSSASLRIRSRCSRICFSYPISVGM